MFFEGSYEGEEELIERDKINDTEINIYHTNKELGILKNYRKFLDVFENLYHLDKFSHLDVVIHINNFFKKNLEKSVEIVNKDQRYGYIKIDEFRKGKFRVHLNFDYISLKYFKTNFKDKQPSNEFYHFVKKVLDHEMTHLWHLQINNISQIITKNKSRLSKALKKTYQSSNSISLWEEVRFSLMGVNELLVLEGLAKFFQEYKDDLDLYEISVKDYYHRALTESKKLNELFEDIFHKISTNTSWYDANIEVKEFYKTINVSIQIIGAHVFQLILFYEKIDINNLARLNYAKILKLYEKVSHKHGFKPIISLRSKNGVFDISEKVKELTKIRKKKLK